ncbi:GMC family oxidoreductase [Microbacterium sp. EST19A]|uniref:GMC family oxidoreductase n=1 Tax=Microbacterium sp. EST19A TaxID=2862681 RepID=UPI001CC17C5C|nr:GMC family oxidoreductase [Microbacterium sp. EST19A]
MASAALPTSVDTLVIGGGTGGTAFTGVLAAHSDESILLVEAGPDYGSFADQQWPADMLDALNIPLSHDYDLATSENDFTPGVDLPRARIIGGCSAHNGCTASIGAAHEYDEWARVAGDARWTADEVVPLLEWARERFRVSHTTMEELTPPQRAFVDAGIAAGMPLDFDLDDIAAGEGIGPMPVNIVDGVRWNGAFAFLDAVRSRPNLRIAGGVQAEQIVVDGGAVTGAWLLVDGERMLITAKRVVIAAGAYHSPALLLRSGIGPRGELAALGIETVVDLPGVGKHLLDHSCVQLNFAGRAGLVDELRALPFHPDEQTVGRFRSTVCDDGPYDIHVFMVAGENSGHPGLPPISLYGGAMRARSEGEVTLGADLDVVSPVIDHRYGTDAAGHDRQVLAEALQLLRTMAEHQGLADVLGDEVTDGTDPLDRIVNYCHPAGSCKMGAASDPRAVVDGAAQVHGVQGLLVADASIMPSITRGNINLPTAMIGARVAATALGISAAVVARTD